MTTVCNNAMTRFAALPVRSAMDDLHIERGSFADYNALSRFHYKSARPCAVMAVFRIVHRAPTVIGRYLRRDSQSQTVGVLVRCLPHLSCQLRNVATNRRYARLKPRDAAILLNREVRTISRVVIDPQWRGLGLAVKLVQHALANPEDHSSSSSSSSSIIYTEALAAMGRVSPFFEHAGMVRYDRPPRDFDARLMDALRHVNAPPFMLASPRALLAHLAERKERAAFLAAELRRWHRAAHRTPTASLCAMTLDQLLAAARTEALAQPLYYLSQHASQLIERNET